MRVQVVVRTRPTAPGSRWVPGSAVPATKLGGTSTVRPATSRSTGDAAAGLGGLSAVPGGRATDQMNPPRPAAALALGHPLRPSALGVRALEPGEPLLARGLQPLRQLGRKRDGAAIGECHHPPRSPVGARPRRAGLMALQGPDGRQAGFAALGAVPAAAQSPGTLRIGIRDDPDTFDPTFSRTYVGTAVMTAICDELSDFDTHLGIVPRLTSGYQWTDPRTLLIHVRPGVLFQDGERLDAAAVVYALQRDLTAPGSFRRSEIGVMDHAEVADPMTVRVVMRQPFSPFVAALTDHAGMMVAPKAAEAAGRDFGRHPICAGPFSFVERVAQDHVTLQRFAGCWDASRIHFDRVTYQVIPDSSIRRTNLEAGALDLAEIAPLGADTVSHEACLIHEVTRASLPPAGG